MIVSRLPPSDPNGDLAATIHTPAFNCFVSTALVDGQWETLVFEGDPGVDKNSSAILRLMHPADCDAHDAAILNELVAVGLDVFGEAGLNLSEASESVAQKLIRKGVVIRVFWPSTRI